MTFLPTIGIAVAIVVAIALVCVGLMFLAYAVMCRRYD